MGRFIEFKRRNYDMLLINKSRIDSVKVIGTGPTIEVDVNGVEYVKSFETISKMNKWIDEVNDG